MAYFNPLGQILDSQTFCATLVQDTDSGSSFETPPPPFSDATPDQRVYVIQQAGIYFVKCTAIVEVLPIPIVGETLSQLQLSLQWSGAATPDQQLYAISDLNAYWASHSDEDPGKPFICMSVAGLYICAEGDTFFPAFSDVLGTGGSPNYVVEGAPASQFLAFFVAPLTSPPPPPGPAASGYYLERMDNRIWQSVEDAYAVDAGISNPMASPNAAIFASSNSGDTVLFSTFTNVFDTTSVGQILRMSGGIAVITTYLSPTHVEGDWILGASNGVTGAPYAAAGSWTLAPPVSTLYAPHLLGMGPLVGLADGVPISGVAAPTDQIGTITLPFAASDVKVGLAFLPQLQSPYLNGQQATQGARKVIPAATIRVAASGPFQLGTNQPDGGAQNPQQLGPTWTEMTATNFANMTGGQTPPVTYASPSGPNATQLWTGDFRIVGKGAEWNSKGQVAIQQTLPLALEVTAILPEMQPGDLPDVTYKPQQGQGGPGGQQQPRGPGRWMLGGGKI
jgi:hypothetical protein